MTFIGTPIDGVGSGSFGVTGKDGTGGSLATDKGGGQAEAVLVGAEGMEHDID